MQGRQTYGLVQKHQKEVPSYAGSEPIMDIVNKPLWTGEQGIGASMGVTCLSQFGTNSSSGRGLLGVLGQHHQPTPLPGGCEWGKDGDSLKELLNKNFPVSCLFHILVLYVRKLRLTLLRWPD